MAISRGSMSKQISTPPSKWSKSVAKMHVIKKLRQDIRSSRRRTQVVPLPSAAKSAPQTGATAPRKQMAESTNKSQSELSVEKQSEVKQ